MSFWVIGAAQDSIDKLSVVSFAVPTSITSIYFLSLVLP